jgi:hypothetical protein
MIGRDGMPAGQPVDDEEGDDLEIGRGLVIVFNIVGGTVMQPARGTEIC